MLDSEGEWPRMRIAIAGKTRVLKVESTPKKKYARSGQPLYNGQTLWHGLNLSIVGSP